MSRLTLSNQGNQATVSLPTIGADLLPVFLASLFIVATWVFASFFLPNTALAIFIVPAAVIGAYMAMNIGANDVANNVAAAVGSRALTLTMAIMIAVVFEAAGALIAGGDVVSTISKGIIDISVMQDSKSFILAMGAALLGAALWLNLATWVGAPVSTTHSIVGGVIGGGVAMAGVAAINWSVMSKIAASWFISPLLGGLIAATFFALISTTVFAKKDMVAASRRWVPVFIGVMAAAFAVYLTMKGLKRVWKPEAWMIVAIGLITFAISVLILRPMIARTSKLIDNRRKDINRLFNIPLIFAAALLCFAHGANDVANAIGPLSAIVSAAGSGAVDSKVGIPLWVMLIGALGISVGLALFGTKLVRTVGKHLTALDQSRAFCVSLSAAITVITASALGLPVSSTHIAIGAIFGVGFYREFMHNSRRKACNAQATSCEATSSYKPRKLVRRKQAATIVAAWFITVPSAALLSSVIFLSAQAVF